MGRNKTGKGKCLISFPSIHVEGEEEQHLYEGELKDFIPQGRGKKLHNDFENSLVWEGTWREGKEWTGSGRIKRKM